MSCHMTKKYKCDNKQQRGLFRNYILVYVHWIWYKEYAVFIYRQLLLLEQVFLSFWYWVYDLVNTQPRSGIKQLNFLNLHNFL